MLPALRNQHAQVVGTVAHTVHDIGGADMAVAFLVHQIETEPRWLRYGNQDGWNQHSWTLAQWRSEAKKLGEVEGRLLRLVLAELRRDLELREQSRPRDVHAAEQLLLEGEGRRLRPRRRGGAGRAQPVGAGGGVHRRLLLPRPGPGEPGDRGAIHRPQARVARRVRPGDARGFPAPGKPLCRVDPPARAAREAPAGEPGVSRAAHALLLPDRPEGEAARAAQGHRHVLSPDEPLERAGDGPPRG